ncbi:MAG: AAA family ATPase, partial [Gammaproteobacteria bacterium]|nr:AAA family ATPase [Gammaproteobacteria bacterium]
MATSTHTKKPEIVVTQVEKIGAVIQTVAIEAALSLVEDTQTQPANRIGLIQGGPGTGKTYACHYLAGKCGGIRVACWQGMTCREVFMELAEKTGLVQTDKPTATLRSHLRKNVSGKLILIDEAHQLNDVALNGLRHLADECDATVILFATVILREKFEDRRHGALLAEFIRRIGTKQISFTPLKSAGQIANYFLIPRFGPVSESVAKLFIQHCQGYMSEAD